MVYPNDETLAEHKCGRSDRDFSELFRNQYLLEHASDKHFPGWSRKSLNGWVLHHGFALRVLEILDSRLKHVGFLLGYALDEQSKLVRDCLKIPETAESDRFLSAVEEMIIGLSGRYLAIILSDTSKVILTDPVSDIPAIYDPETRRVGSSLGLVLRRPVQINPLFDPHEVLTGKQTLGFGQTLDRVAMRAVPNHTLSLADFSQRRYWPKESTTLAIPPEETQATVYDISQRLSAHMATWVQSFKCLLPVTGGRDSRALLACTSEHLAQVSEFMAHRFNNNTRRDAKTAYKLITDLGYPFEQYFLKHPSIRQKSDMRIKMGWSGYRGELAALHALERYPEDSLVLRGNIMELLRANQYRSDRLNDSLHLQHGLRRTGVVRKPSRDSVRKWKGHYMAWYNGLPENAQKRTYDFGFLEMLLPNTQSSYITAMHRGAFINPFNDRKLIAWTISIPPEVRFNSDLYSDLIEHKMPDLLKVPFN